MGLSNEIIESLGWKMVFDRSEWSNLFRRIGDETLTLRWFPSADGERDFITIERDCNKPNEAYKDNIYVKFNGYCDSKEEYEVIVKYLNFNQ